MSQSHPLFDAAARAELSPGQLAYLAEQGFLSQGELPAEAGEDDSGWYHDLEDCWYGFADAEDEFRPRPVREVWGRSQRRGGRPRQ